MRVLIATHNAGKVRELERLLSAAGAFELVGLEPGAPEVEEDGETFEANALKKARAHAARTRLPTLADDSGIEVDALGGAPGVESARYAGIHGDDEANNVKLLAALEGVEDSARTARFRCALAYVDPASGAERVVHGTVEGTILRAPRGVNGFGYDPLFLPIGRARTTAEMSAAQKDAISHRAEAVRRMAGFLVAQAARAGR